MQLLYALKDGKTVHISEVESGQKCGCICPACGEPLVAKKGKVREHHFAHQSGRDCEYGYETSLHLAAKEIISKAKKFFIPELFLEFPNSHKRKESISPAKEIPIDDVKLEERYGDIIPDIVIISGAKELFVEIFVTHRIDDEKLEKLKKAGISTIEIDLSKQKKILTSEELTQILLGDTSLKTWKYNAFAQKQLLRFYEIADERAIVLRGGELNEQGKTLQVDDCPIKKRLLKKKPYANFRKDCLHCEYCISFKGEEKIFCSGRLRISELQDFNKTIEERIQDSKERVQFFMRSRAIIAMVPVCPECGGKLVIRKQGAFLGCSNYPACKVMVITDPNRGFTRIK